MALLGKHILQIIILFDQTGCFVSLQLRVQFFLVFLVRTAESLPLLHVGRNFRWHCRTRKSLFQDLGIVAIVFVSGPKHR